MEYGSTIVLDVKKLFQSKKWIEREEQHFGNVQRHEQRQEIDRKFLFTMPNIHTNCHFKNMNLKVQNQKD